jgi:hypothetical protein
MHTPEVTPERNYLVDKRRGLVNKTLVIGGIVIAAAIILYFLWQAQQTSAANLAASNAANATGGPTIAGSGSIIGGATQSLNSLLSSIGGDSDLGSLSESFSSGLGSNSPGLEDDDYDDD